MMRVLAIAATAATVLSACGDVTSTVTDQVRGVRGTLSGALAPVRDTVDDVTRRAHQVGEGINEVSSGIGKVKGAFSGSGTTR